jgi:CheY-like chemotaxis protein
MTAEEKSHLFDNFYQGEVGRASAEGAGLGLFISQAIVHKMHGEIEVSSTPGVGSEFRFWVEAPEVTVSVPATRRYKNARVPVGVAVPPMLVVDDRETNRDVLSRLLRGIGFEVDAADGGEAALACCAARTYGMVWMDLRMPGMDGTTALARLRADEREHGRPLTPVVAITASVIDYDREAARQAGFDDLVGKPFLDETVCRTVESLLGITLDGIPEAEAKAEPSGGDDPATLVAALPVSERADLLEHLVRGDLDGALRIASVASRLGLRTVIESFQVDGLINALRRE